MEVHTLTAETALFRLLQGNAAFIDQQVHPAPTADEISRLDDEGQHPWAVVVTCSDSRVPPELVFDCGLGDLFVIRTAGHVLTEVELGSVEYAVTQLGVQLLVVLGHSHCGAVAAALSGKRVTGALGRLLEDLLPSVEEAEGNWPPDVWAAKAECAHIHRCARRLRENPVLAEVEGLLVAEAKYNTHTGRVSLLNTWTEARR